ncbi:MAG: HD domain-containing protein [Candidatus Aminicenantes bacterium]|nr:HD domain-containing protein [Candidatus Aminicenantes bacterium]
MKTHALQGLEEITGWFTGYVRSYKNVRESDRRNVVLKEEHTFRVCEEILELGGELGLTSSALRLAAAAALLHDVGRFEQYARYKTFADEKSEDHARLSVETLRRHDVLRGFSDPDKTLIFRAIECHNRASLPPGEKEPALFFIKLLRDADKLDIWRVVTDYYRLKNGARNSAVELDLPDTPGFSEEVRADLVNERIVDIAHVRNLNDFKLLQIGWIFDINFPPTFRRVRERRYLETIRGVLPETDGIGAIFDGAMRRLLRECGLPA